MKLRLLAAALAVASLAACTHYGQTNVDQGATTLTGLYFVRTPPGARVQVDGVDMGAAGSFTGSNKDVLGVATGTHRVTVSVNGQILFDKPVYVGSGDRVRVDIR